MAEVLFIFEGREIIIQCDTNDRMKDIINKCVTKIGNDNLYFIYNGQKLNEELKFNEQANEIDKERNKMNILVYENNKTIKENKIISKEFICPECDNNILIDIKDYKINYKCKNEHIKNNILINEYIKTQIIDISKIICNECKEKNKNNTYNNEFYQCLNCNINLCPLCNSNHDKNHNIINYDDKYYICKLHNELYIKYCKQCNENICIICENNHNNHEMINLSNIINKEEIIKINEEFKNIMNKFKNEIEEIKNKINNIFNN